MSAAKFSTLVLLTAALACSRATSADPPSEEAFKERWVLGGHTDAVTCVAFVGKGKTLASGSSDKAVKLWDMTTGKELATLKGHEQRIQAVAGSSDGKTLASGDDGGVVKIWDVPSAKERKTLVKQKGTIEVLRFSPDGKILASGGGGYDKKADKAWAELMLWDAVEGKELAALEGHDTRILSLAFAPDGKTMVSCSADGNVILWDVAEKQKKAVLGKNPKGGSSVAFSPDGKTVACGSFTDSTVVKFWDAASAEETQAFTDATGPCALSLTFLPDGKNIVLGGLNTHTITDSDFRGCYLGVWDIASAKERFVLKGHKRAILGLALAPDEKLLASAGLDKTVHVWELADVPRR